MTILARAASHSSMTSMGADVALKLLRPVYMATIFLSAFLLFSVQPMFTKMVTPTLGGSSGVWSVALVFFQAMLLAGYGYAHVLATRLSAKAAVGVHLGLVAIVALVALPIGFNTSWGEPPPSGQAFWLIGLFTVSVGLPFFAVSANGPLLQAWFSRTVHKQAHDPYFLYAASNLASFLALLSYPFVIEFLMPLTTQAQIWAGGFCLLLLCLAASALTMFATQAPARQPNNAPTMQSIGAGAPTWSQQLSWVVLSFVPSALLVAVTAHVTTDVAAVPLLWVIPLALFLLSFVVIFRPNATRVMNVSLVAQCVCAGLVLFVSIIPTFPIAIVAFMHLAFFFASALVCHGELFKRRPDAKYLSNFYFMMSLGGVLGGAFVSLLTPLIFNSHIEYPLLVIAAMACRPGLLEALRGQGAALIARKSAIALAFPVLFAAVGGGDMIPTWLAMIGGGALVGFLILGRTDPVRQVLAMSAALASLGILTRDVNVISRERSFFAVHTISTSPDRRAHVLLHGTTKHGAEWARDADGRRLTDRPQPASYFSNNGVYQQAIAAARTASGGTLNRVAVIGLGMGSLACSSQPGESWTFYEIDPVVVRLAQDQSLFRSLSVCTPGAPVILGDGRLTIAKAKEPYDLIILDAFSSDSVPVHLLTVEALAMYRSKLNANGSLIFNISNRHLRLDAIVAASAQPNGFEVAFLKDSPAHIAATPLSSPATVAIASASQSTRLLQERGWKRASTDGSVWTDSHSNIISPMLRLRREGQPPSLAR